ncbi:MAG: membrane protein insertase YidC [Planctomycetes bacterium]|nr:membrane protein insertase YidC [Planctomycetota bacterium]
MLWAVIAILMFKACSPDSAQPGESIGQPSQENFSMDAVSGYPIVLENEFLRTEWSATGASCGKVSLKQYADMRPVDSANIPEADWLVLMDSARVRGKVPNNPKDARHFHYRTRDAFALKDKSGEPIEAKDWNLVSNSRSELVFEIQTDSGYLLRKSLRLMPGSYHIDASIDAIPQTQDAAGDTVSLRLSTGGSILRERDQFYPNPYSGAALRDNGVLDKLDIYHPSGGLPASRSRAASFNGDIPFIVEGSKYFLNAIHAIGRDFRGATSEALHDDELFLEELKSSDSHVVARAENSDSWQRTSIAGAFSMRMGRVDEVSTREFQWYLGPKDRNFLTETQFGEMAELPGMADFDNSFFYRMFGTGFIAPAILWLVEFFQSIVGNWGFAIILMTLLVRGLLFPINRTSQVKMAGYQAKMAKIKPKIDALNAKFGKDPQRKQQETMKLYKEHKVSPPIGGCLPMLLQFPVFIGLFAALRSSILLRQRPFMGWVQDLSRPDAMVDFGGPIADYPIISGITTFNLLPIVMVILWVLHQKSMPKSTDPQQAQMQKMMAFMPVLFGVMLYNYAAGLSLYMITSSLVGIFESKVIKKRWPVPTADGAKGK